MNDFDSSPETQIQREICQQLLGPAAVGEYTTERWLQVEQSLVWWSRQRTTESVRRTFQLLDRSGRELEHDQQQQQPPDNSNNHKNAWLCNTQLSHFILNNWRAVYTAQPLPDTAAAAATNTTITTTDSVDSIYYYTPERVCDQLERHVATGLCPARQAFFHTVLQVAAHRGPVAAEAIWDRWQRLPRARQTPSIRPTTDAGNIVIRAWCASESSSRSSSTASTTTASTSTGSDAAQGWGAAEAAHCAERVLDSMLANKVQPNQLSYQGVIYAWAAAGMPHKAQALLQRMYSEYKQGDDMVRPDCQIFTTVMFAWAKSGQSQAGERAEQLLAAMRQVGPASTNSSSLGDNRNGQLVATATAEESESPLLGIEPDTACMNAVLSCYAATKSVAAAKRAENMLWEMTMTGPPPDYESYLMVTNAWAAVGEAEKAQAVLDQVYQVCLQQQQQEWVPQNQNRIAPTVDIFTTVIAAWARSSADDKVARAQAVLDQIQEWNAHIRTSRSNSNSNDTDNGSYLRPSIESYNALLTCIANSKQNHSKSDQTPALQADRLLHQIKKGAAGDPNNVRPNRNSYTTVIHAWAKVGRGDKAQAIFREMLVDHLEFGNENAKPDLQAFNVVLSSFVKWDTPQTPEMATAFLLQMQRQGDKDAALRPDAYSYSSVLNCLARTVSLRKNLPDRFKYAEQAESILADMQLRFQAGDKKARPNTVVYNCVLNAWALTERAPERAEALLQRMYQDYLDGNTGAKPSKDTFNTLIKAWAFAKHTLSPQKAVEILDRMEELHMSGALDVFPDVVSYTTAMLCMSFRSKQRGAPQRAEELMRRMDALYESGRLKEGPNKKSYMVLRKTWMTSKEKGKKERVAAIENEMKELFGPIKFPPKARSKSQSKVASPLE